MEEKEGHKAEHHATHHASKEKKNNMTEKLRENPWILSTLILGIIVLVLLVGKFGVSGSTVSEKEINKTVSEFMISRGLIDSQVLEITEESASLYSVSVSIKGEPVTIYVTKDGENLIPSLIPLSITETDTPTDTNTQTEQPTEVPKSDKPVVELFVVSYCPYGLQAEKGFLPVMELLKDKASIKIIFMPTQHGQKEEDENRLQICLREEQESKYLNYLKCFLESGNSTACLITAKIDNSKLQSCLKSRIENLYEEDLKKTDKYGISASPTLIINGVKSNAGRDSESYLVGVCNAFNTSPDKCTSAEVSNAQPSPGFGSTASASSGNAAQCGS